MRRHNEELLNLLLSFSLCSDLANGRAVYTAIFGRGDSLKEPLRPERGVDYICFTNIVGLRSSVWKIVEITGTERFNPVLVAKLFKILPHFFLKNYGETIWVDGSIVVKRPLFNMLKDELKMTRPLVFFSHPNRTCVYRELVECIRQKKDKKGNLERLENVLRSANYPAENGLIAGGFIYARHTPETLALLESWMDNISAYSLRDQLTFNYTVWTMGGSYESIDRNIFLNEFLEVLPHAQGFVSRMRACVRLSLLKLAMKTETVRC